MDLSTRLIRLIPNNSFKPTPEFAATFLVNLSDGAAYLNVRHRIANPYDY